jgi:hypothetical protein
MPILVVIVKKPSLIVSINPSSLPVLWLSLWRFALRLSVCKRFI